MDVKLAEALLRRKELQQRLDRMGSINNRDLFEVQVKRINVTENTDEVTAGVPKMTYDQFQAEYNFYARQLRRIDAAIQQANWTTEIPLNGEMNDYQAPDQPEG